MINCLTLKTEITLLLADELGKYRFPDDFEEPAIAIIPDSNYGFNFPTSGTVAEGLEVVIVRPIPQVSHFLNSGRQLTYRWGISLKQWDSSKSLLEPTLTLIKGLDYLMSSPKLIPPNPGLGNLEEVRFELIEHELQGLQLV